MDVSELNYREDGEWHEFHLVWYPKRTKSSRREPGRIHIKVREKYNGEIDEYLSCSRPLTNHYWSAQRCRDNGGPYIPDAPSETDWPTCTDCCTGWVEILERSGFEVPRRRWGWWWDWEVEHGLRPLEHLGYFDEQVRRRDEIMRSGPMFDFGDADSSAEETSVTLDERTPQRSSAPPIGSSTPLRRQESIQRIVRRTAVGDWVKQLHEFRCQVCGMEIPRRSGLYAEAAHIRPLGAPHDGPDSPGNVLCLCPNHHVMLDYDAIVITEQLKVILVQTGEVIANLRLAEAHIVELANLRYHRSNIGGYTNH